MAWLFLNRHCTDLLVLPEGLIYSIRSDAEKRALLPEGEGAEAMWGRLSVYLGLLINRQAVWGDPRHLYGQSTIQDRWSEGESSQLANPDQGRQCQPALLQAKGLGGTDLGWPLLACQKQTPGRGTPARGCTRGRRCRRASGWLAPLGR